MENTILIALWVLHWTGIMVYGDTYFWSTYGMELGANWYFYPGIIGHYVAFTAGILFMIAYYYFFHPSGNINKSIRPPRPKRTTSNDEPSNNRDPQNNEQFPLQIAEQNQTSMPDLHVGINLREDVSKTKVQETRRPKELYIEVDKELSNSKTACRTPSMSSPVLDKIDSVKENTPEGIQLPINRSASVPAVTPPLSLPNVCLYVPAHRRLKAMHGKERFITGDGV